MDFILATDLICKLDQFQSLIKIKVKGKKVKLKNVLVTKILHKRHTNSGGIKHYYHSNTDSDVTILIILH